MCVCVCVFVHICMRVCWHVGISGLVVRACALLLEGTEKCVCVCMCPCVSAHVLGDRVYNLMGC